MNEPEQFRTTPVEIQAIRWTGDNEKAVQAFAPDRFYALDEDDRASCDDPDATAQVWDHLHGTWILVMTGQWVIRGTKGEHYPCDAEVFAEKYQWVGGC